MDKRTFKCLECNHTWEVEYGIKRPSECPNCGSVNLHRENGKGKRSYRWRGGEIRDLIKQHNIIAEKKVIMV